MPQVHFSLPCPRSLNVCSNSDSRFLQTEIVCQITSSQRAISASLIHVADPGILFLSCPTFKKLRRCSAFFPDNIYLQPCNFFRPVFLDFLHLLSTQSETLQDTLQT
jgi:hypothetical protein